MHGNTFIIKGSNLKKNFLQDDANSYHVFIHFTMNLTIIAYIIYVRAIRNHASSGKCIDKGSAVPKI
jgi:hypothetical protein